MQHIIITTEEYEKLEDKSEYGRVYMELTPYSEQIKELLTEANDLGVNFRNFIVALFEDPGKLGPLGLIKREVVTTGTGDRVIVFEFGEAGNKVVSALRAIKAEI